VDFLRRSFMSSPIIPSNNTADSVTNQANWLGFYTAILMTVVTVITFGIAIFTPPISGPSCVDSCIEYPYLDIVSRFPRDYLWMYLAIILTLIYVVFMACIHNYASVGKKLFSQIGLSIALMAATILIVDYFLQLSVIQPSLESGETEGIALLTQYNPHGIFIALEEIGYLLMSVSFLCIAPIFSSSDRVERAIRWIFSLSFFLAIITLIVVSLLYGIDRSYRFEIIVISIDWLVLTVTGMLVSIVFKRTTRMPTSTT